MQDRLIYNCRHSDRLQGSRTLRAPYHALGKKNIPFSYERIGALAVHAIQRWIIELNALPTVRPKLPCGGLCYQGIHVTSKIMNRRICLDALGRPTTAMAMSLSLLCSACSGTPTSTQQEPLLPPSPSLSPPLTTPTVDSTAQSADTQPIESSDSGKIVPVRPGGGLFEESTFTCHFPDGDVFMTKDKASCDKARANIAQEMKKVIPESQMQSSQDRQIAENKAQRARDQCFSDAVALKHEIMAKGFNGEMAQNMALIQLGCK